MNRIALDILSRMEHIHLSHKRCIQKQLASERCTIKQHLLLNLLARHDELTPSEVAEKLYSDRPTTSIIVQNTAKAGWIKREMNPGNRRSYRIMLTDSGRTQLLRNQTLLQHITNPMDRLSEKELKQLYLLLGKVDNH